MPANRKDTLKVNGVDHNILYNHANNSVTLKSGDGSSVFVLEAVEGQYDLQLPNRRDLVVNELLKLEENGTEITTAVLIPYGFREQ